MALVGMQQNGAATAAGVIHRMIACPKHGWGVQDDADCRRGDYFKANLAGGHNVLTSRRRAADICTVTPEWGTRPGMALRNGMVRNTYWTTAHRLPRGQD